jgi:hypothetical protein
MVVVVCAVGILTEMESLNLLGAEMAEILLFTKIAMIASVAGAVIAFAILCVLLYEVFG